MWTMAFTTASADAVVADLRLQVLRVQEVYRLVRLLDDGARHLVLVEDLGFLEEPDLDGAAGHESVGLGMEQQDGGVRQIAIAVEPQMADEGAGVFRQRLVGHAPLASSPFGEPPYRFAAQVIRLHVGDGRGIPALPLLAQEEGIQRRAAQKLVRRASANVVLTLVAHRKGLRLHLDLEIGALARLVQHDCRHDTQPGYDLVGDVLEEATRVGKPRHAAVVAYADVERPALRVGEAADPLEVLVAPRALVFDGLAL